MPAHDAPAISSRARPFENLTRPPPRHGCPAIRRQRIRQAEELAITSYVVREQAVPDLERVLALIKRP